MNLIYDWRTVLKKAWSVKFNVAAAVFGGIETAVQFWQPDSVPKGVFAAFAAASSVLAVGARVMAQKEINNG